MKIKPTRQTYTLFLLLLILFFPKINAQDIGEKSYVDSLNFLVISDFGGQGGKVQKKVGVQLGKEATLEKCSFVITCGDNYHQSGISSPGDPRWKTEFEDIYSDNSLMIPWYASLGNHDYNGNPDAQIEYSQISKRWHLPSRYYSHTEKINDTTDVLFVHLDTSPFITEYREKDSIYHVSGQDIKTQLRWFDSVLSHSEAHWKIVIGHHPIYSSVEKRGNTRELIDQILPLLEKYNVQIYFCGHEHFMQYLVDGSVNSFICGSAALTRPASSREDVKFCSDTLGFISVTVTYNIAQVNYINDKGVRIYSAIVEHKK